MSDKYAILNLQELSPLQKTHKIWPFRPISNTSRKSPTNSVKLSSNNSSSKDVLKLPEIRDAETGEVLQLTKSKWSSTEGRLNLDHDTIVRMGSGQLNISVRAKSPVRLPENSVPALEMRHPLVEQFFREGPQTKPFHRHWNARTDAVENPCEDGDDASYDDNEDAFGCAPIIAMPSAASISKSPQSSNPGSRRNSSAVRSSRSNQVWSERSNNSTINSMISPSIAISNVAAWQALEERVFLEIFRVIEDLENNKQWTKEKLIPGGLAAIEITCRRMAKLKVKSMKEVVLAIEDEESREETRQKNMDECTNRHRIKDMRKQHAEEREKFQYYLETLQKDNEIIFLRKMGELGWLW